MKFKHYKGDEYTFIEDMAKIIIENKSDLGMDDILSYIGYVIRKGKVSKTSKGEQYCFMTMFENGIYVSASKNKKSDRFIVGNY